MGQQHSETEAFSGSESERHERVERDPEDSEAPRRPRARPRRFCLQQKACALHRPSPERGSEPAPSRESEFERSRSDGRASIRQSTYDEIPAKRARFFRPSRCARVPDRPSREDFDPCPDPDRRQNRARESRAAVVGFLQVSAVGFSFIWSKSSDGFRASLERAQGTSARSSSRQGAWIGVSSRASDVGRKRAQDPWHDGFVLVPGLGLKRDEKQRAESEKLRAYGKSPRRSIARFRRSTP